MLGEHEVGVWYADLDGRAQRHAPYLVPQDHTAARTMRPLVGQRWLASRAALRWVIAQILEVPPERVRLSRTTAGQPVVAHRRARLRVSLARADDLCVIAVTRARAVGVDLERISADLPEASALASRWLDRSAATAVRSAEGDAGEQFVQGWTRREAWLKAVGTGLAGDQDRRPIDAGYQLIDLRPDHDHLGAVAIAASAGPTEVRERSVHWCSPTRR